MDLIKNGPTKSVFFQVLEKLLLQLPLEYWICAIPLSHPQLFEMFFCKEEEEDGMEETAFGIFAPLETFTIQNSNPFPISFQSVWMEKCLQEGLSLDWNQIINHVKSTRKEYYIQKVLRDWNQFYFENTADLENFWKDKLSDNEDTMEEEMVQKLYRARRSVYMELMRTMDDSENMSSKFREQACLFGLGSSGNGTFRLIVPNVGIETSNDMIESDL